MKPLSKRKVRSLVTEFSSKIGNETLKVRFYRERGRYVCERELIERDGTSFTMVLPFKNREAVQKLLAADPFYPQVRLKAKRALSTLDEALRAHHDKPMR